MTNNYTININKSFFEKSGSTVCTDVRCIFYIYLTSERNIFRFYFRSIQAVILAVYFRVWKRNCDLKLILQL